MTIKIITIGRTTDTNMANFIDVYLKRLKHYIKLEYIELPVKLSGVANVEQCRNSECDVLLKNLKPQDFVILLDEKGKEFSSAEFSVKIEKHLTNSQSNLNFVIGGAYGFNDLVYKRANEKMALSKMTFTHQMVRLIFVEQLYRAFTIIKNEKYHH